MSEKKLALTKFYLPVQTCVIIKIQSKTKIQQQVSGNVAFYNYYFHYVTARLLPNTFILQIQLHGL